MNTSLIYSKLSLRLNSRLNTKQKLLFRVALFLIVLFSPITTQAQYVFAHYSRQVPFSHYQEHRFSVGYQFENNLLFGAELGRFSDAWDIDFFLKEPNSLGGFIGYRIRNKKTQVIVNGGAYQFVYEHINYNFQIKEYLIFTELQVHRPLVENLNIGVSLSLYKPIDAFFTTYSLYILPGLDIRYNFNQKP